MQDAAKAKLDQAHIMFGTRSFLGAQPHDAVKGLALLIETMDAACHTCLAQAPDVPEAQLEETHQTI